MLTASVVSSTLAPSTTTSQADSVVVDGVLYYGRLTATGATSEIVRTDGTLAGTTTFGSFPASSSSLGQARQMTRVGSRVFFVGAPSPASPTSNVGLWSFDAGTSTLSAHVPVDGVPLLDIRQLTSFNGKLYFSARTFNFGYEMYTSDGTAAGTVRVTDLAPGAGDGVGVISIARGSLFLGGRYQNTGRLAVYRSDGTLSGTQFLAAAGADTSDLPNQFVDTSGGVIFSAGGSNEFFMWVTDGTPAGTVRTTVPGATEAHPAGSGANRFAMLIHRSANSSDSTPRVRRTDGTAAGTTSFGSTINVSLSIPTQITPIASGALIGGSNGLFRVDPTGAPEQIIPSDRFGQPRGFVTAPDGRVYFSATLRGIVEAFARTDGTVAGTSLLFDPPGAQSANVVGWLNGTTMAFANNGVLYSISPDALSMPRIAGRVYSDDNSNGDWDPGEGNQSGVTLSIESRWTRNADGTYFLWVQPGTPFTITANEPSGRVTSEPASGPSRTYTLAYGANITDADFGFAPAVTFTGTIRVSGSSWYSGSHTAYLDLDQDGSLDSGEPSALASGVTVGSYTIRAVPGSYTVRVQAQQGFTVQLPLSRSFEVSAGAAGAFLLPGTFVVSDGPPTTYLRVASFEDVNRNGARDAGEPGAPFDGLWVDLDDDGTRDAEEPSPTTVQGSNSEVAVQLPNAGGSFRIRNEYGPGFVNTIDVASTLVTVAAGDRPFISIGRGLEETTVPGTGTIEGRVFNDVNGNGAFDAGEQRFVFGEVFLDLDGDASPDASEPRRFVDSLGRFRFANVAPGSYAVRQWIDPRYRTQTSPAGFGGFTSVVQPGQLSQVDFGSREVDSSPTSSETSLVPAVYAYEDYDGNGSRNAVAGMGFEPSLEGFSIFIDRNGDGRFVFFDGDIQLATTTTGSSSVKLAAGIYPIIVDADPELWTPVRPRTQFVELGNPANVPNSLDYSFQGIRRSAVISAFDLDSRVLTVQFDGSIADTFSAADFKIVNFNDVMQTDFVELALDGRSVRIAMSKQNPQQGPLRIRITGSSLRLPGRSIDPPTLHLGFQFYRGDANGDLRINFDDLLILASNYNQSGRAYTQGNFDDDANGTVNFDDLLILASLYNLNASGSATLAAPPPGQLVGRDDEPEEPPLIDGVFG